MVVSPPLFRKGMLMEYGQGEKLIPYSTISAMAEAWEKATATIEQSITNIKEAQDLLKAAFQDEWMRVDLDKIGYAWDTKHLLMGMRRHAWSVIIKKSEIKRVMSPNKAREFEELIASGEVPEITEGEISNMIKSAYANAGSFFEDAVIEVFKTLRPCGRDYKNNRWFAQELGDKTILCCVERKNLSNKFRVRYHHENNIRAIDNVFHALDGKGFATTYHGQLYDAIEDCTGQAETEYFKVKCFGNGNAHIKFKRMDIVRKINAIVKEKSLTSQNI